MIHGVDMGLAGRTAIVCGSSDGLGKACALALAHCGVSVVINGRNPDRLAAAAREFKDLGLEATPVAADVTTAKGRAALLAANPTPDILVNNAGGPPSGEIRQWNEQDWMTAINANMMSAILLTKSVLDGMVARRWGRIISITSWSVKGVAPMLGLSTAARAGLTGYTATLAREIGPHGVTVNNLLPGAFETTRLKSGLADAAASRKITPEAAMAERVATVPVGRVGNPDEFGTWCVFLASTHAGYITGQNILLDGGAYPGVL